MLLDDVAISLDSRHNGLDLADEEECVKVSKSATIRYQPETLTREELDFFLSLDFETNDNDDGIATRNKRASFPLDTVQHAQVVDNSSANTHTFRAFHQDSTSTLESNISSLSAASARAGTYSPNRSFSTLQTSMSHTSSSNTATIRNEFANQVHGQEFKLISAMKRSAESREVVQRVVRNSPPASFPNATFDINASAVHYERNAYHSSDERYMIMIDKKRKREVTGFEKEEGCSNCIHVSQMDLDSAGPAKWFENKSEET